MTPETDPKSPQHTHHGCACLMSELEERRVSVASLSQQLERLASYVLRAHPEMIAEGGAVDVTIEIMTQQNARLVEAKLEIHELRERLQVLELERTIVVQQEAVAESELESADTHASADPTGLQAAVAQWRDAPPPVERPLLAHPAAETKRRARAKE